MDNGRGAPLSQGSATAITRHAGMTGTIAFVHRVDRPRGGRS